jgi:hypothetical protein
MILSAYGGVSIVKASIKFFKHFLDDSSSISESLESLIITGIFSLSAIRALGFSDSLL